MPISKGEACRAIVVGGRLINPLVYIRIKEPCVVNTARMFIQKNPSVCGSRVNEVPNLLNVFVKGIPRASFGVTVTDADIAGNAPNARRPTPISLSTAHVNIGRAFEDILVFAKILSEFGIFIIGQEKNVG